MKTISITLSGAEYAALNQYAYDLMASDEETLFACIDHALSEIYEGNRFWQSLHVRSIDQLRTRGDTVPKWARKPGEGAAVKNREPDRDKPMPESNEMVYDQSPEYWHPERALAVIPVGRDDADFYTPVVERIMRFFGCARSTAQDKLKQLVRAGLVRKFYLQHHPRKARYYRHP